MSVQNATELSMNRPEGFGVATAFAVGELVIEEKQPGDEIRAQGERGLVRDARKGVGREPARLDVSKLVGSPETAASTQPRHGSLIHFPELHLGEFHAHLPTSATLSDPQRSGVAARGKSFC